MTKVLITAIFLSQAPIQDLRVFHEPASTMVDINYDHSFLIEPRRVAANHVRRRDNNPFRGARSMDIDLVREDFTTKKAPVPYAGPWANSMRQTAQQFIAIISTLQEEGIYYDWEQSTR